MYFKIKMELLKSEMKTEMEISRPSIHLCSYYRELVADTELR